MCESNCGNKESKQPREVTIRDQFAAQAMLGLLTGDAIVGHGASDKFGNACDNQKLNETMIAKISYIFADAMLRAREV